MAQGAVAEAKNLLLEHFGSTKTTVEEVEKLLRGMGVLREVEGELKKKPKFRKTILRLLGDLMRGEQIAINKNTALQALHLAVLFHKRESPIGLCFCPDESVADKFIGFLHKLYLTNWLTPSSLLPLWCCSGWLAEEYKKRFGLEDPYWWLWSMSRNLKEVVSKLGKAGARGPLYTSMSLSSLLREGKEIIKEAMEKLAGRGKDSKLIVFLLHRGKELGRLEVSGEEILVSIRPLSSLVSPIFKSYGDAESLIRDIEDYLKKSLHTLKTVSEGIRVLLRALEEGKNGGDPRSIILREEEKVLAALRELYFSPKKLLQALTAGGWKPVKLGRTISFVVSNKDYRLKTNKKTVEGWVRTLTPVLRSLESVFPYPHRGWVLKQRVEIIEFLKNRDWEALNIRAPDIGRVIDVWEPLKTILMSIGRQIAESKKPYLLFNIRNRVFGWWLSTRKIAPAKSDITSTVLWSAISFSSNLPFELGGMVAVGGLVFSCLRNHPNTPERVEECFRGVLNALQQYVSPTHQAVLHLMNLATVGDIKTAVDVLEDAELREASEWVSTIAYYLGRGFVSGVVDLVERMAGEIAETIIEELSSHIVIYSPVLVFDGERLRVISYEKAHEREWEVILPLNTPVAPAGALPLLKGEERRDVVEVTGRNIALLILRNIKNTLEEELRSKEKTIAMIRAILEGE